MRETASQWYVLDENNEPMLVETIEEWGRWFENTTNRIVGYTEITSQVHVSTVFLGLDHNWSYDGPPILFETMVFGGPHDESQWRYRTYAEAKRGHDEVVAMCRQKVPT